MGKKLIYIILLISLKNYAYIPKRNKIELNYELDNYERKAVTFWEKIFSQYSSNEIILHDSLDYTIYEVIKIPQLKDKALTYHQKVKIKKKISDKYKLKYSRLLKSIYEKTKQKKPLSFEEKYIQIKLKNVAGGVKKFLIASKIKRLRTQQGQKEEVLRAYERARPYLKKIEVHFKKEKIPWEITRLPVIESMFQSHAHSAAGAVGIWQILKPTAKRYLKFNRVYDPRKDPIKSTYAAAKILKHNYKKFKSWPLTILSYNIGRYGTLRAMQKTQSKSLREIVENHKHRTFGFSARNYFYELVAIVNIEKNFETYFNKKLNF
jgi:membrane-bound lytic murein transglycosylase D